MHYCAKLSAMVQESNAEPEFIGSSVHHNSVARGLRADKRAMSILRAPPPACTVIDSLDTSPSDLTFMTGTEPRVVHGVTREWRGTDSWTSEETLVRNFGSVKFDVAPDVSMTVAEYCRYAAQTAADFPYYIYEWLLQCFVLLGEIVIVKQQYVFSNIKKPLLLK